MESCSCGEVPQRSDHEQIWHTKSIKLSNNKSSDLRFFASSKSLMAAYQSSFYLMFSKHSWVEFKTTRGEKGLEIVWRMKRLEWMRNKSHEWTLRDMGLANHISRFSITLNFCGKLSQKNKQHSDNNILITFKEQIVNQSKPKFRCFSREEETVLRYSNSTKVGICRSNWILI